MIEGLNGECARLVETMPIRVKAAADIRASELGPQSVAVGAATMILKAALDDSRLFPAVGDDTGQSVRRAGA